MLINVLKSKIAYATVTQKELHYVGSITIDRHLMQAAGLVDNEQVHIVNLNNGERLVTYVIPGEAYSGVIGLNGPAARCVEHGDPIFIIAYAQVDVSVKPFQPRVIHLKQHNQIDEAIEV
ncbi:MAG: aspartate 1-decarboxylase [Coxiellaceae bacterium]|nr:aspartate 1-decarboxylase [Coxiellaceae bacterium]|tara:strand:- start:4140 stop:4499 length:360 start_codon:yes stop_codon:yes gene_type:complete